MKAHDLAELLLKGDNAEISASIDISTGDDDCGRRLFTNDFYGVNATVSQHGEITLLFSAHPQDNYGKDL